MKILITVGIYPPDIGGPASFVPKIAKMLSENEHDVTVICLSDNKFSDEQDKIFHNVKPKVICNGDVVFGQIKDYKNKVDIG